VLDTVKNAGYIASSFGCISWKCSLVVRSDGQSLNSSNDQPTSVVVKIKLQNSDDTEVSLLSQKDSTDKTSTEPLTKKARRQVCAATLKHRQVSV
jgi:hypothetical protein